MTGPSVEGSVDPLFSNLSAEDSTYTEPTEIESLGGALAGRSS